MFRVMMKTPSAESASMGRFKVVARVSSARASQVISKASKIWEEIDPVAPSPKRTLRVRCGEGWMFEIDEEIALMSSLLTDVIEGVYESVGISVDTIIPLSNVYGNILSAIIGYCRHHTRPTAGEDRMFGDDGVRKSSADRCIPMEDESSDTHTYCPPVLEPAGMEIDSENSIKKRKQSDIQVFDNLDEWEENFILSHWNQLTEILKAADTLDIQPLVDLIFAALREVTDKMDPKEVQECYNLEYDLRLDSHHARYVLPSPYDLRIDQIPTLSRGVPGVTAKRRKTMVTTLSSSISNQICHVLPS